MYLHIHMYACMTIVKLMRLIVCTLGPIANLFSFNLNYTVKPDTALVNIIIKFVSACMYI